MTGEEYRERLAALFRENGFVFSITVDPANLMRFALSCDAEDEDEICRRIVMEQYHTFKSYPGMLKSVELADDAECVVANGYGREKVCRLQKINVTLNPAALDVGTFKRRDGRPSYLLVKAHEGCYDADGPYGVPRFMASFPSRLLASRFGTRDFVLVQSHEGGFWDGSTALMNGFALCLAPDVLTYRRIFEAQVGFLRKTEK